MKRTCIGWINYLLTSYSSDLPLFCCGCTRWYEHFIWFWCVANAFVTLFSEYTKVFSSFMSPLDNYGGQCLFLLLDSLITKKTTLTFDFEHYKSRYSLFLLIKFIVNLFFSTFFSLVLNNTHLEHLVNIYINKVLYVGFLQIYLT